MMETIATYLPIRERLSQEEFARQYPFPYLVLQPESAGKPTDDKFEFQTIQLTAGELESATGGMSMRDRPVHKIVKRGTNAFEGMINVGRAGNNDVVLDIQAVSKFHAYFSMDVTNGHCYITDADSTNGSFINKNKLNPHQRYILDNGDTVSFAGTAELKFYTTDGFWEMLTSVI